jgi:hypothetical protein
MAEVFCFYHNRHFKTGLQYYERVLVRYAKYWTFKPPSSVAMTALKSKLPFLLGEVCKNDAFLDYIQNITNFVVNCEIFPRRGGSKCIHNLFLIKTISIPPSKD